MTSRGLPTALSARSQRGFVLFWAALFVLSLMLQYASVAAPRSALAFSGLQAGTLAGFEVDGDLQAGNASTNPGAIPDGQIFGGPVTFSSTNRGLTERRVKQALPLF
jgi:hypothetical protein